MTCPEREVFVCSVGETLDAAFGEDGDSEEEDAIVNQVLDEIGISINERVRPVLASLTSSSISVDLDGHCPSSSRRGVRNGFESTTNE